MKTKTPSPVKSGSHNAICQALSIAEINPGYITTIINIGLQQKPKHKTLKEAIHYKIVCIHAERLIFLLSAP